MSERDTFVGYIHPDFGPYAFGDCLADLLLYDGSNNKRVNWRCSMATSRIASGRNEIMRAFLGTGARWLHMLDADMMYPRNQLDRMLYVAETMELKLLTGLYFQGGRGYDINPCLFTHLKDEPRPVGNYVDNMPISAWAAGAGALLIHRDVVEDVLAKYQERAEPWFEDTEVRGISWGEDVTFCRRAFRAGHELVVHTGIEYGHAHLSAVLNSTEFRRRQALSPEEYETERAAWYRMIGRVE